MIVSRISSKGQITLPGKVRRALNLKAGDRVLFLLDDESVRLQPLAAASASALAGSLRSYSRTYGAGSMRDQVKREVGRAAAREGR